MEAKKSLAQIMYEQEEKDIENAIRTLNKFAIEKSDRDDSGSEVDNNAAETEPIDQKAIILEYLENSYSGAKMMDDVELMCRLSRAILAFSYDDMEKLPSWEEMQDAYFEK